MDLVDKVPGCSSTKINPTRILRRLSPNIKIGDADSRFYRSGYFGISTGKANGEYTKLMRLRRATRKKRKKWARSAIEMQRSGDLR